MVRGGFSPATSTSAQPITPHPPASQGVMKFFQELYQNGDEDFQRAMMKSYVESGDSRGNYGSFTFDRGRPWCSSAGAWGHHEAPGGVPWAPFPAHVALLLRRGRRAVHQLEGGGQERLQGLQGETLRFASSQAMLLSHCSLTCPGPSLLPGLLHGCLRCAGQASSVRVGEGYEFCGEGSTHELQGLCAGLQDRCRRFNTCAPQHWVAGG